MFCEKCGTENRENAKYCKNCGTQLETITITQHVAVETSGITTQVLSKERKVKAFLAVIAFLLAIIGFILSLFYWYLGLIIEAVSIVMGILALIFKKPEKILIIISLILNYLSLIPIGLMLTKGISILSLFN